MFEMHYDIDKEEYTIAHVPDICLDIIVDLLFNVPKNQWLGEIISDEMATAIAIATNENN